MLVYKVVTDNVYWDKSAVLSFSISDTISIEIDST
jgi:hypothetical protein